MNLKSLAVSILSKVFGKKFLHFLSIRTANKPFEKGYLEYLKTGVTSQESYLAMIDLYCLTNGKFNENFHRKNFRTNRTSFTAKKSDIFGKYTSKNFSEVNSTIEKNGYFSFQQKLTKDICDRLENFSFSAPSTTPYSGSKEMAVNLEQPISEIYRLQTESLINNEDIQSLIMDPVLIELVSNYLGCEPVFDYPSMWWTTDFKNEATSEAAQLYHFDMDRIKWLKVFFYITPVTKENGPHCYIEGTHLPNTKPSELLKKGYARITDKELHPYYKDEDVKLITGERGSCFAGDTKCWHKGTLVESGARLVLELNYTASMFGANRKKHKVKNSSDKFKDFYNQNRKYLNILEV